MAKKRSSLICPKCKKIGGALSLSWSKGRSGVPKINSIRTVADAFDAVGKMYLNLHILQLLKPPTSNTFDNLLPLLSKFSPYPQDKLNEIINSYFQNPNIQIILNKEIEPFKKHIITKIGNYEKISKYERTIYPLHHVFNPEEIGRISKLSISSLCYALVCFSIRDFFNNAPFFINGNLESAIAIFHSHEVFLHISGKNALNLFNWFDILEKYYEHGNHAAVSLNKHEIDVCKKCSKLNTKIKEYVFFKKIKNDKNEYVLQCPNCGGHEKLQQKISVKYLKEIRNKKVIEIETLEESLYIYEKFVKKYSQFIKSLNEKREELIQHYKRNEEKFLNGDFERKEYYSIGHYNPDNKNKKCCRFTDLSQVKLEDSGYQMYERLISQIVDIYILSENIPPKTDLQIQYKETCRGFYIYAMEKLPIILKVLQFPIKFLDQKIQADLILYYQNKRYFN